MSSTADKLHLDLAHAKAMNAGLALIVAERPLLLE
jgi:hypothetical protein